MFDSVEVASFGALVENAMKNNTAVAITSNITFNSTVHIMNAHGLVFTAGGLHNATVILDGRGMNRLFDITQSHVEFRGLIFTNGFTADNVTIHPLIPCMSRC